MKVMTFVSLSMTCISFCDDRTSYFISYNVVASKIDHTLFNKDKK